LRRRRRRWLRLRLLWLVQLLQFLEELLRRLRLVDVRWRLLLRWLWRRLRLLFFGFRGAC
jgi:hypothetical protein